MSPVRTIIVDDHALVGAGIEAVLAERSNGRFQVVGASTRADDVEALIADTGADLALIDLHMPPPGGVTAIRRVVASSPRTKVVALSGEASAATIADALAAGAVAFLPKTLGPEGLVAPLMTVVDGGGVLPVPLLREFARLWRRGREAEAAPELGDEDQELLTLVCRGLELAAMAEALHVSPSTVKRRLAALEAELGVGSRIEAAHRAGWWRLVAPEEDPEADAPS